MALVMPKASNDVDSCHQDLASRSGISTQAPWQTPGSYTINDIVNADLSASQPFYDWTAPPRSPRLGGQVTTAAADLCFPASVHSAPSVGSMPALDFFRRYSRELMISEATLDALSAATTTAFGPTAVDQTATNTSSSWTTYSGMPQRQMAPWTVSTSTTVSSCNSAAAAQVLPNIPSSQTTKSTEAASWAPPSSPPLYVVNQEASTEAVEPRPTHTITRSGRRAIQSQALASQRSSRASSPLGEFASPHRRTKPRKKSAKEPEFLTTIRMALENNDPCVEWVDGAQDYFMVLDAPELAKKWSEHRKIETKENEDGNSVHSLLCYYVRRKKLGIAKRRVNGRIKNAYSFV